MTDKEDPEPETKSVTADVPMVIDTKSLSETEEAVLGLLVSAFAQTRDEIMRIHRFDPTEWQVEDEPLRRIADAAVSGAIHPLMHALRSGMNPQSALQTTMSGIVMTSFFAGRKYEISNPSPRKDGK